MANNLSESVPERTFQHQNSLPPLPVPSLESSLSKYLDAGRTFTLFCGNIIIKCANRVKKKSPLICMLSWMLRFLIFSTGHGKFDFFHQFVLLRLRRSLRPQRSSWRTSNRVLGNSCTRGSCRELKPGGTGCVFGLKSSCFPFHRHRLSSQGLCLCCPSSLSNGGWTLRI